MTAEIVIMNKLAIAMAADSALTIGPGDKIFTSSNKLFMLSKYHPVGIMIYGNPELIDVPWETIIKIFRKERKKQSCNDIVNYMDEFIDFVMDKKDYYPLKSQEIILQNISHNFVNDINENFFSSIDFELKNAEDINKIDEGKILDNIIISHHDNYKNTQFIDSFDENSVKKFIALYDETITEIIVEFKDLKLNKKQIQKIKELIIGLYLKKSVYHSYITGIVIAGFGEDEIYPSYKNIVVKGILNNEFIIEKVDDFKVTNQITSCVRSFAQVDMVQNFMTGIHPDYRTWLLNYLEEVINSFPEKIVENLPIATTEKKSYIKKYKNEAMKLYKEFQSEEKNIIESNYQPILKVVDILPKDELALMAETLVNLTLFKRRISMEIESVGGPIDVAVISKGDGFIWIKRKHYFDEKLNPSHLRQYYTDI